MEVAGLILPVFAVIVTGWVAGFVGFVSRDLSDGLIHFAYNVAMPALLIVTIAREPARSLFVWRFLIAFGGGSLICFALVFLAARIVYDGARLYRTWLCGLSGIAPEVAWAA
jgi:malonate transporter and related proteins